MLSAPPKVWQGLWKPRVSAAGRGEKMINLFLQLMQLIMAYETCVVTKRQR